MDKVKPRTLPTVHDFAVLLGFISLAGVQLFSFADDPGVGWHLKTGEFISGWRIPFVDPFLAAFEPRAWIADQWLSDLLLWSGFKLGGFEFLYGLLTFIFLSLFFWFCWANVRRYTNTSLPSTLAVLLCFKLSQIHFILRPVIFSFVLFAILYFYLLFKSRGEAAFDRKDYAKLFLVFLFWANLHPSFVLGAVLFALYCLSSILKDLSFASVRKLMRPCLVILAASLINPYGWNLHASVLQLGRSVYFMSLHQEWQPVDFSVYSGQVFAVMLLTSVVGLVVFSGVRKAAGWFAFLTFLLFASLCFSAIRFLPYFGMSALVLFALTFQSFGARFMDLFQDRLPVITGAFAWAEQHDKRYAAKQPLLLSLGLLLLVSSLFLGRVPFYAGKFGPSHKKFPYQEADFLTAKAEPGSIVLAPPQWGGFLVFQSDLQLKPVLDDRNTLIGEELYRNYFGLFEKSGTHLLDFLVENNVSYLLVPLNGKLDEHLQGLDTVENLHMGSVASAYRVISPD